MGLSGQFHAPAVLLTWTNPSYKLAERLGGPQSRSGCSGKITFNHIGNRNPSPRKSSAFASRYGSNEAAFRSDGNHRISSIKMMLLNPTTYYTYRQFNIQQSYVLPTQCVYVFCVDLRTAIISLYNINRLVCIPQTGCIYCAVRTWCLYII
jgi:hypothetical protein